MTNSQETAKDTLKKLVDEKTETLKRMSDVERSLSNTEDEIATLKELYDREVEENRKLAEEISSLTAQLEAKVDKDEAADVEADGDEMVVSKVWYSFGFFRDILNEINSEKDFPPFFKFGIFPFSKL